MLLFQNNIVKFIGFVSLQNLSSYDYINKEISNVLSVQTDYAS